MDSSAVPHMDPGPLFGLAVFGVFCAMSLALGAIGGLIWVVATVWLDSL